MVPTHLLEVTLLGRFAVVVGGREIPARAWGSRRAQQLVKLLALAPRQRLTTEQILDALWPDRDPGDVNAAFRQTCYLVRRALDPPDLLTLRAGVLTLAAPGACLVDTLRFEQAANAARRTRRAEEYVAALALFAGELLPEDRYTDWVLAPAERLHGLASLLRRELAALHEQTGDGDAAEALWRRILDDDPADEPSHVGLMRLYAGQGQRQRAVRQYHTLHARLHEDLDLTPEPATRRLYAAILGGQYPPPAAPAPVAPATPLPPHALPKSLTTLIGREAEIGTVGALLGGSARLVTLTGAGGSGKTRLALAVAEALLPGYPDGVWWVDLAALTAGALVAPTTAEVLGVRPTPGQTPLAALISALRDRTLLLVLDNAEHLRDACAELALTLLRACPQVRVLVTSRAPLRVVGEQTWRVPSLVVPAAVADLTGETIAALAANDAVRLFVARARLAAADFAITPANAASVVEICRQVEGVPLAIELAAARLAVLEPGQLAARLHDALSVLTSGARGVPDRQRTLRATLDWSYGLLAEPERRLLRQLSAFAGGWTLDAAEAICAAPGVDLLAELGGLVEHSLVQVEAGTVEPRYRLLEPTRQYARAHLAASAEEDATRTAHATFFLAFAEAAEPKLEGATRLTWIRRVRDEIGNVREALRWWQGQGDAERGVRLAAALRPFWRQQEYIHEGWHWLRSLVPDEAPPQATPAEARACLTLAELAGTLGNWAEGSAYSERSRATFAALGDELGQARALSNLAMNRRYQGEIAAARVALEGAIGFFERAGDQRWVLTSRLHLGVLAFDSGDLDGARANITAVLPELRQGGDARLLAVSLLNLATYTLTVRQREGVGALLSECLDLAVAIDEQGVIACALAELADLAILDGQAERAARLLGMSQALHRRTNLPVILSERPFHERVEAAARAALGDPAYVVALAAGAALPPDAALAEAKERFVPASA